MELVSCELSKNYTRPGPVVAIHDISVRFGTKLIEDLAPVPYIAHRLIISFDKVHRQELLRLVGIGTIRGHEPVRQVAEVK